MKNRPRRSCALQIFGAKVALVCLTIAAVSVFEPNETFSASKNKLEIVYPEGAPGIVSDFGSRWGINGKRRDSEHQGIDIKGPEGQPILAAADGIVLEAMVEKCWGPTIAIDHGNGANGRKLIALYGHVGEMLVERGDTVSRGDLIAYLGDNHFRFKCIHGVRHLHFQLGLQYRRDKGSYWGHMYFLKDGMSGLNPHMYWSDGKGRVTCFTQGESYNPGFLTYPVPCN